MMIILMFSGSDLVDRLNEGGAQDWLPSGDKLF